MPERRNKKDRMIDVASELFMQQGYEATSVRQIADEVGVTEAALYYHFKEGKQELLQAVIACQMPNFKQILDECKDADSLEDLILRYGNAVAQKAEYLIPRIRWFICEFSNIPQEEKNYLYQKQLIFHDGLAELIEQFVDESETANALAWTLMCAFIGHNQLFGGLNLKSVADFPLTSLVTTLAKRLK